MTELIRATSAEHFAQFRELVDELMAWDSSMSAQLGLDVDSMLGFLYNQPGDIDPDQANADVFLATDEGSLAGCGALKHLSKEVVELSRLYVRPAHRGRGIARKILEAIVASARARGYTSLCLETATFMTDAHALYRSVGFRETKPFREVPDGFKDAEVFMSLRLAEAT
jgi:GNAT superfamily N-acetyltransferase